MRSKVGLMVGWMLVTLTAVGVTSAAVESVRANVTDSVAPAFVLQNEEEITRDDIVGAPESTSGPAATSSTIADPDLETFQPPTGAESEVTPRTVTTATTQQTTLTQPPATSSTTTTTTTTPSEGTVVKTYTVVGGSVTVEASNNNKVTLLGAVPNSGFSAKEEERSDPTKVVVEFVSSSQKSKIEIRWRDGKLVPDVDEESQD